MQKTGYFKRLSAGHIKGSDGAPPTRWCGGEILDVKMLASGKGGGASVPCRRGNRARSKKWGVRDPHKPSDKQQGLKKTAKNENFLMQTVKSLYTL